ncbi:hypothetical protein BDV95DRAFT_608355 [Massariosphaeria phaeospora]|uniref:F-box domain-containing protein n=1 Tax=Massariosphaeria phaeospora TaxID=100035 RepID=A0A7C8I934_9PLEO|nr:hypothetical protein BDV95DRAFT_608355 [Massariosphaeria phaeospora]
MAASTPPELHLLSPELAQRVPAVVIAHFPRPPSCHWTDQLCFLDYFLDDGTDWVWSLFARPVAFRLADPFPSPPTAQLSRLECLPSELLELILDALPGPQCVDSVFALGMCSRTLWNRVFQKMYHGYCKCAAPWAEQKVAFVDSEVCRRCEGDCERILGIPCVPKPYIATAVATFTVPRVIHVDEERYQTAIAALRPSPKNIHKRRRPPSPSMPSTRISISRLFPQDREWLLRNHTTREYISSFYLHTRNLQYTYLRPQLTFHRILLSKICWTDKQIGPSRGAWAGHRFDVVTRQVHGEEEGAGGHGWEDGSVAAETAVLKLWRDTTRYSKYGKKYGRIRNHIRSR